jgi:hypothetical protein
MPTLAEMKAMSPAYAALTDQEFADRVYQKHYAGKIDRAEFDKRTAPVSMTHEVVGGLSGGFNKGIDALVNLPGSVLNLGAQALGYDAPFEPVRLAQRFNVAEPPRTATGRVAEAVGEVAGSSVVPTGGLIAAGARAATGAAQGGSAVARGIQGIAQRAAADPKRFAAMEGVASAGAGTGVGLAREDNAGPIAELGAGVLGGIVAPLGYSALARTGGAVRDAAKYGTNMASRARNPQLAADQDVADALSKSGLTADDVRGELAPKLSTQLQARGLTDADAADIVSRVAAKEPAADIAKDYGISESTVKSYAAKHREMTPTPRNIVDVTKDLAGDGASKPITRLGRAAFGIADDGETTQALTSRQDTQGGRLNTIIKKAAGGRDYDAETARLDDELGAQAKQAYAVANQNAQPFNLRPALRQARKSAFESAGDIRTGLEKAVDLFFEPVMAGSRVRKLGQPISDMKRFQASREALDQMIETSFKDGKPTRLTRKLTQLRQSVNNVVRNANPDMAAADDMFSGAKSSQAIMKQGQELTTRLGAKTADALKGFDKLNPDQKDLYRLSFLQKLDNMVANPRDGAGLANQFQSEAVRKVIRRLFAPDKRLSAKENKAIRARGEELIKRTREEATTTKTLNEVTGRGNSPTAPWQQDMGKFMAGAKAGADVLTGRWGAVLDNLTNRLTYQIGERQAKAIMETLTETDPSKVLPMLNRLARQAKTTKERMEYVTAIRQFRKAGPGSSLGTGIVAADQH